MNICVNLKKQDDKLRKAQQMREAQEKEKAEKQRKLLQVNFNST